jgi:hypothetical protein
MDQLLKVTLTLLLSVATNIFLFRPVDDVLAASPSFGYQELKNTIHNILDVRCVIARNGTDIAKCLGNINTANQSIDIAAIDYFSDGNVLNATLWLLSNISKGSPDETTSYGMYIDADSNAQTGLPNTGADYLLEISQHNGKWIKTLSQLSSYHDTRILNRPENYTDSIKTYEKYIPLSLDLNAIGFSEQYKILFYSQQTEKQNLSKIDFTTWVDIPPQKLMLTTIPSDVSLRPGERQQFGIQLASTSGLVPEVLRLTAKNTTDFEISFNYNTFRTAYQNTQPALFEIKIPEDAVPGKYSVPIIANISKTIGVSPYITRGTFLQEVDLPVTVIKRMTLGEQLNDFNETWISPLSGIYSFIGGLFTGEISRFFYNRIKGS